MPLPKRLDQTHVALHRLRQVRRLQLLHRRFLLGVRIRDLVRRTAIAGGHEHQRRLLQLAHRDPIAGQRRHLRVVGVICLCRTVVRAHLLAHQIDAAGQRRAVRQFGGQRREAGLERRASLEQALLPHDDQVDPSVRGALDGVHQGGETGRRVAQPGRVDTAGGFVQQRR